MADSSDDPLLDLSTTVERKSVVIDGEQYSLRHPDEFSLPEQQRLAAKSRRMQSLMDREQALDDDEASELETSAREMVGMIMPDLPLAVDEKLTDGHRMAIVNAFTRLSQAVPETATTSQL